jgi:hypothetical protein
VGSQTVRQSETFLPRTLRLDLPRKLKSRETISLSVIVSAPDVTPNPMPASILHVFHQWSITAQVSWN